MVPPGFSVSDIASFVNGTIRFIVCLVDAPSEIRAIENQATFGNSILASLQRKLDDKLEGVDDVDLNILHSVKVEYGSVVRDLNDLAKKHRRCEEGNWGARFVWVVTEHFTEQCVKINTRLETTRNRIETTLSVLHLGTQQALIKVTRNTSELLSELHRPPSTNSWVQNSPPLAQTAPAQQLSISTIILEGAVNIWIQKSKDNYEGRDVGQIYFVKRKPQNILSEIRLVIIRENKSAIQLRHLVSGAQSDLAESVLPLGNQLMLPFTRKNSQIRHMIRTLDEHGLYYGEKPTYFGVLEYSFTSERDFENFQGQLRGQINELNLEIDSIQIHNKWQRAERVSEILQLWRKGDHHILRFFQNIPNQMFAEYRATHLEVDSSKRILSREDPRILKLISNVRLDPSSKTSIRIRFRTTEEKDRFGRQVQFNSP